MWGAGCILIEMLNGYPCFPGVRDVFDQLDKIFRKILFIPNNEPSAPSVSWSVGRLVGCLIGHHNILKEGGKIHFHAPIGALAYIFGNYVDAALTYKKCSKSKRHCIAEP